MGNLLTFFELTATALWFGGAATAGAHASRLRRLFLICAVVLMSVAALRGSLWGWTPVHTMTMALAVAAGIATRWWARIPGLVFGLAYIAWIAHRGY